VPSARDYRRGKINHYAAPDEVILQRWEERRPFFAELKEYSPPATSPRTLEVDEAALQSRRTRGRLWHAPCSNRGRNGKPGGSKMKLEQNIRTLHTTLGDLVVAVMDAALEVVGSEKKACRLGGVILNRMLQPAPVMSRRPGIKRHKASRLN
jgi:hypothetical protein